MVLRDASASKKHPVLFILHMGRRVDRLLFQGIFDPRYEYFHHLSFSGKIAELLEGYV